MGWLPEALSEEQREPSQKLTAKLAMQLTSLDPIRYLLLDHIGDGLWHSPQDRWACPDLEVEQLQGRGGGEWVAE